MRRFDRTQRMLRRFFQELKRRRVYQTIGLYIVGAWIVLQVADLAFDSWGIPDAALQSIWSTAFLLFPLALVFGWRYDITSTGIVRTPKSDDLDTEPLLVIDHTIIAAIAAAFLFTAVALVNTITQLPRADSESTLAALPLDAEAIAVLPFLSRSTAEETGFFADGVHDDLLTTLSNISSLKVISRTSVLQYRETTKNLRQIGQELGAANILEGGIQHIGDQVRINVQLINALTDEHIWAHTYDREMTIQNLFAIQTEIAETIAKALALELSSDERTRIRRDRTDNIDAFNAYNRGKQSYFRMTFEALRAAEVEFKRAVEIDPDYVLARIALARTYDQLVKTGAEPLGYQIENGQAHIDRAIELDPENGYALAVLANYERAAGAVSADAKYEQALLNSPNSVDVLDIYASYLRSQGRNQDALVYINRALELDPLSTSLFHDLGRANVRLGRFEEANVAFRRIGEIDPKNPQASHGAAMATILGGQLAEAGYWTQINAKSDPDDFENTSSVAIVYMSIGDLETAREAIDYSLAVGPMEPYPLSAEAYFLTLTGRREEAVNIARTALANQLADRWGSGRIFLRVLRDEAIVSGSADEALGWYRQRTPELFEKEPQIDQINVQKAADLANLLQHNGEDERARLVLERVVNFYGENYVRGAANYPMGVAKAEALALLGSNNDALKELQRVTDDGWRVNWRWNTEFNRNFDGLRDDPRFVEIMNFIESDLAAQVREFDSGR